MRTGSAGAATGFAGSVGASASCGDGLRRSTTVVISGKALVEAWLTVRVRSRGGVFLLVWTAPLILRVGFSTGSIMEFTRRIRLLDRYSFNQYKGIFCKVFLIPPIENRRSASFLAVDVNNGSTVFESHCVLRRQFRSWGER